MATPGGRNLHFTLDPIYTYLTLNDRGMDLLHQIAGIYEAGNRREQSEILMDGTVAMMVRSHQRDCATDLGTPLPVPTPLSSSSSAAEDGQDSEKVKSRIPESPQVPAPSFKKCRKCAGQYVFSIPSGDVTIIVGAPNSSSQQRPYKTMSYVWGTLPPTSPISIPCLACGHTTHIPMLSVQRFHNLMSLGGGGNCIWLDALSINQDDPEDVKANIAIMGEIYKNADCVSVLLPASDRAAYECLEAIERDAKVILMHRGNFVHNTEMKMEDPESGENINVLSVVCQMFLENIQSLVGHLHQFAYWSRAWTFQEWALAPDLEVAIEGWDEPSTCFNLKSLVLGAAMLISRYKILQHQYAEIKLGRDMSRGMVPPLFNVVKALFPDEDLFLSYEETDPKSVSFQTNFPHNGITDLLGIRSVPFPLSSTRANSDNTIPTPRSIALAARTTPLAQLRARLILLLSAFASSKRFAKYEADLVACWASMCNIPYAYDRGDDFTTAKRKVIDALRGQGMIVYEFIPDRIERRVHNKNNHNITTSDSEQDGERRRKDPVDLFRMYAKEQPQLNATNNAEFPGAPMFTGRADTVSHLIFSLENIRLPTIPVESDSGSQTDCSSNHFTLLNSSVLLHVQDATITDVLSLSADGSDTHDLTDTLKTWSSKAIYGHIPGLAGFQFWDTQEVAKLYLEKVPLSRREMGKLVIVKMKFYKQKIPGTDDGGISQLESQIRALALARSNVSSGNSGEAEAEAQSSTSAEVEQCDLHLWAIVPSDIPTAKLEVCREPINGALVFVLKGDDDETAQETNTAKHPSTLIAYLVLSDHLSGSFLVCPNREGGIDLEVRVPERGDMANTVYRQFAVRRMFGDIRLV